MLNFKPAMEDNPQWYDCIQPAYDKNGKANFLDSSGAPVEGIFSDVPNEVYHAIPAYSSSLIKLMAKATPAHVYRKYFSDVERKRTSTQRNTLNTGTLGHELILEPEHFYSRYFRVPLATEYPSALSTSAEISAVLEEAGLPKSGTKSVLIERCKSELPDVVIFDVLVEECIAREAGQVALEKAKEMVATKECTSVLSAFHNGKLSEFTDKQPMDGLVWDDAHRIKDTFSTHPRAKQLINDGFAELTMIAKDPNTDLMLKVKFDYINRLAIASDVKTTRSANPQKFRYQCRDLRYDVQETFYKYVANLAGVPCDLFAFIAIEYAEADICEVFELPQRRQQIATNDMHEALSTLNTCIETDNWHGYTKQRDIVVIDW